MSQRQAPSRQSQLKILNPDSAMVLNPPPLARELPSFRIGATNQVGAAGKALFQANVAPGDQQRFFRVAAP